VANKWQHMRRVNTKLKAGVCTLCVSVCGTCLMYA